jgi:hypothetical protein
MAKVYSWEVRKKPRTYAYIIHPYDINEQNPRAFIGSELEGKNLENVKNWAINCTDDKYKAQFEKMTKLCEEKEYKVEFESVESYLYVTESCDNLRGPEGRCIDYIESNNTDPTKTTYTIHYTDGTEYSFTVLNGKDGKNGADGKEGAPGDIGVASRQVTVYINHTPQDSKDKPKTPTGGNYDFGTHKLVCPEGWHPNCDGLPAPIWMSSRTFASTPESTDKNWTTPVKITGDNGIPGADGITTEFIYFQGKGQEEKPNDPNLSTGKDKNGKYPHESGYVPSGWTGSPQGITEEYKIEYCSTRNKTVDDNKNPKWSEWSEWSDPFIWSKWGTNGMDGDGVQYIYLLAKEKDTPGEIVLPEDWQDDNSEYQNASGEWIPGKDEEGKDEDKIKDDIYAKKWYDSPLDVTINYPHLWVSIRKYRYDDAKGKKLWGKYSTPSLFAKYGQDGKSATYIRKIYKITDRTKDVPTVPGDGTSAAEIGDWSLGFPSNYENGVNVVWATEAEASAADNNFVYHYKRISTTVDNKEELPEEYKNKEKFFYDEYTGTTVPDTKVHPDDTVDGSKFVGIKVGSVFYLWSGGWCPPYLVTGVKGDSADPINYTTYVFAYGYSDSTPGVPTGNSIENLSASQDGFGRKIHWEDAPIVEIEDEANNTISRKEGAVEKDDNGKTVIRRWYQCIGHVNSSTKIVSWGAVVPLYAKDGEAGKNGSIPEYRFFVTATEDKPIVTTKEDGKTIRIPYTEEDGQKKLWLKIDDSGFNSDIPSGGAMWQIWAYITTEKKTSKPEEPTPTPQSNEDGYTTVEPDNTSDNESSTNNSGNSGGESGSDTDNSEGSEGGEGSDEEIVDEEIVETISKWYGPVRISGERGKSGERGPAGLRGVTGVPGANYIQMYCLGTPSKEVKPYDFDFLEKGAKFSDGYFGGIYKEEETSILPKKLKDWYDSKNIPDSTVIECDSNDELESVKISRNIGRVCVYIENKGTDNEKHIYYLITGDQKGDDKTTPAIDIRQLTNPLSKDEAENFNIYTWCLQGIETWTTGNHKKYVELKEKPDDADEYNTELVTDLPDEQDKLHKYLKIKQNTSYIYYEWQEIGDKDGYVKFDGTPEYTENNLLNVYTEEEIPETPYKYLCIKQKPEGENTTCIYYEWKKIDDDKYGYVKFDGTPEYTENNLLNVYTEEEIPDTPYKYLCIEQNHKGGTPTYKYYEWQEIEGDEVTHTPSITWGPPFRLQGADGLKGKDGTRGQMIYPMGVYSQTEVYITTTEKAPYVYDPSDGMFYVYNVVGEDKAWVGKRPDNYKEVIVHPQDAKESNTEEVDNVPSSKVDGENVKYIKLRSSGNYYVWNGTKYVMVSKYKYSMDGTNNDAMWYIDQNGDTPSSNYSNNTNAKKTPAWVRFESFQALYTSLGIIENGLIGSAVYNNEFMYSQYGINNEGKPVSFTEVAKQGTTSGFLSGYEYDEDKKQWKDRNGKDYIDKYDVDPYKKELNPSTGKEEYIHTFMPNVCINFLTGQMWLSTGKAFFNYDGTGHLASEAIKWEYEENDPNRLKLTIGDSNNQGIELSIDKYETLNKLFGATVKSGAVLTDFLGIRNENDQIVAALDGSGIVKEKSNHGAYVLVSGEPGDYTGIIKEFSRIPDTEQGPYIKYIGEDGTKSLYYKWTDFNDRSIILASGMVYSNDTEDLDAVMESAKTKIYSDGTFETKQGVFEGKIIADTGSIGAINIDSDGLSVFREASHPNDYNKYIKLSKTHGFFVKAQSPDTGYTIESSLTHANYEDLGGIYNGEMGIYSSYNAGTSNLPGSAATFSSVSNYGVTRESSAYFDVEETESYAIKCTHGNFAGFRPKTVVIKYKSEASGFLDFNLTDMDYIVVLMDIKNKFKIYLPNNPQDGQEYKIFVPDGHDDFDICSRTKLIWSFDDGKEVSVDEFREDKRRKIEINYVKQIDRWLLSYISY